MALNKTLLLKIKQAILDEPRGFQMSAFAKAKSQQSVCDDYGLTWEFPRCGTALCIAGHAVALSGGDPDGRSVLSEARELLGIRSHFASYSLFYAHDWPKRLEKKFFDAKTPEERAQVGAERIDLFLAENE